MAEVTLGGNPVNTIGELPAVGSAAPSYTLAAADLSDVTPDSFTGKKVVLNIFPSVDTPTCAASVRAFNAAIADRDDAVVVCISKDLPFAQARFCGTEGLSNVVTASAFRSDFGTDFGVLLADSKLAGLFARAVVVVDESGNVVYTELVPEIAKEPNYDAALAAL